MATITFVNESSVEESDPRLSLLQIAEKNGIPHMHVCGGMARCSTCRVMVIEHPENLTPVGSAERKLAEKLGFEPNIRLACQTRPTGDVSVRRLTLDDQDAEHICSVEERMTGREAKLAILFSDIRGFTTFSENALPYDVVHVLNRYFYQMGEAILSNNGYIDKYIGDGIMALFGVTCSNGEVNCRNALNAALKMQEELEALNVYLTRNFNTEFKIGVGIHYGEVVMGELGHPKRRQVTAIGDAVNMASRIESVTKDYHVPLLISDAVVAQLRGKVHLGRSFSAMLKGKSGEYSLHEPLGLTDETIVMNRELPLKRTLNHALRSVVTLRRAPAFLRAAFHDAGSYDPSDSNSGANGALRLKEVYSRLENRGLDIVVALLEPVKKQYKDLSWADLFLYSGAFAVKLLGGPEINIPLGRKDGDVPPPPGIMNMDTFTIPQLKARFARMGFSVQELVALSGSHTVGKANGVPMTEDWFRFNNKFFKALLAGGEAAETLLAIDREMAKDSECLHWIQQYAIDESLFFNDFANAYRKMSLLGTPLK